MSEDAHTSFLSSWLERVHLRPYICVKTLSSMEMRMRFRHDFGVFFPYLGEYN